MENRRGTRTAAESSGHGAYKRDSSGHENPIDSIGHGHANTRDIIGHSANNRGVKSIEQSRNRRDVFAFKGIKREVKSIEQSEISEPCLEKVMKRLADPNTHLIGVYGSNDESKDFLNEHLIEKVCRRVNRDHLFDMVLIVTVTKKTDVNKIQEEIARQLELPFNNKSKDKRAHDLIEGLEREQKILIILRDLHKELDLGMVGIPYGTDHPGCKILLISTTEDVLCQMNIQERFHIGS